MSIKDSCVSAWEAFSATIANGTSFSESLNLGGLRLFSLGMPDNWTAANLTFQMSTDGGATWLNMYDQNGNEIVAVAGASRVIVLNPIQFASVQYLRLRSGTAATPVAQTAARGLQLILRSV